MSHKKHKVHYIYTTSSLSNSYVNLIMSPRLLIHKYLHHFTPNRFSLPTFNYHNKFGTRRNSSTNIRRISIFNSNKDIINSNKNTNRESYHTIFYSKNNFNNLNKHSNSVKKLNPTDNIYKYTSPKKKIIPHISIFLNEKKKSHHRCLTLSNIRKSRFDQTTITKNQKVKKNIKKDKIKINLFKKVKNPQRNNQLKIIKIDLKNKKKEFSNKNKAEKNNRNKTEKNKKIVKKIKQDLKSVSLLQSKEERIKNLLYGIPYMTERKKCQLCHKPIEAYLYKCHYYSHPTQILNWLFLGTIKNANNLEEIKDLGIKYILNCANDVQCKNISNYIKYCQLNLTDSPDIDITTFFDQAFSFIELARTKKEKILIHCKLGVSRSPSILIGYLIKHMGYTAESALEFLKSKRSQVYPNSGFIYQLYEYEKKLKINRQKNVKPIIISNSNTTDFSVLKK